MPTATINAAPHPADASAHVALMHRRLVAEVRLDLALDTGNREQIQAARRALLRATAELVLLTTTAEGSQ